MNGRKAGWHQMHLMFALLLRVSIEDCEFIDDLAQLSDYSSLWIGKGRGYCLRFWRPHGVFAMTKIGDAHAEIYYSSFYYANPSLSLYTHGSTMYSKDSPTEMPRAVSFGNYYGLIYVTASKNTTVYFSYIIANNSCSSIAISTKQTSSYKFPNNSAIYMGYTYCFLYTLWGIANVGIMKYSPPDVPKETMYIKYRDYLVEAANGKSVFDKWSPLQIMFKPESSDLSARYFANLSSFNTDYYDGGSEGEFPSVSSVCYINGKEEEQPSSKSVVGITLGCIFGVLIIAGIAIAIIWRKKNWSFNFITKFYKRIPSTEGNESPVNATSATTPNYTA